ncbi:MAG: outer membrane lipoprotein carrier protein LolA [Spirochaetes bacterium]|nr:outer membrane lipoprotein carrier protein LolA [Spirochaetota bacterium]
MKIKYSAIFVLLAVFIILNPVFALSGDEAVANFKARMSSIGTLEGVISITYSSGNIQSGNFKYMAPGKIYVKFTNPAGKIIVSNGKKLWIYDTSSAICGVQELGGGGSGGIASFVNGYYAIATSRGSDTIIKLKSSGKTYSEVTLLVDSLFTMKNASFRDDKGNGFSISLSGLRVGENMHAGLFDFDVPSNAQLVKDPLNIR